MQLGTNADYLQTMIRGPISSLMLKNDFRILRTIMCSTLPRQSIPLGYNLSLKHYYPRINKLVFAIPI